jgi:hypothetical protein
VSGSLGRVEGTRLYVSEWELPGIVGGILFRDPANMQVWHCLINQNDSLPRKRFSLLREIGHLIFDATTGQTIFTEIHEQALSFIERQAMEIRLEELGIRR